MVMVTSTGGNCFCYAILKLLHREESYEAVNELKEKVLALSHEQKASWCKCYGGSIAGLQDDLEKLQPNFTWTDWRAVAFTAATLKVPIVVQNVKDGVTTLFAAFDECETFKAWFLKLCDDHFEACQDEGACRRGACLAQQVGVEWVSASFPPAFRGGGCHIPLEAIEEHVEQPMM